MRSVRTAAGLTVLAGIFLLTRFLLIFFCAETVSDIEELYRGTIAMEILRGLKLSLWDYQVDSFSGGSLLTGLLAVPFFALMGPSLLALKMVPLFCFGLPALILLFFFLKRNFGAAPAAWGAVLFVFSPPAFAVCGLYAMGFHSESILFSLAAFCSFYHYVFHGRHPAGLVLAGLFCGLGISFAFTCVITLVSLAAGLVFVGRKKFFSKGFLFAAGVSAGLLPWFYYNFTHDWSGLIYMARSLAGRGEIAPAGDFFLRIPGRLLELWTDAVPQSLGFPASAVFSGLEAGRLTLMLLLAAAFLTRSAKSFFLILFAVIFSLVYAVSEIPLPAVWTWIESRYFIPLHLFLFLAAAPAAGRPAGRLLLAGVIAFCAAGQSVAFIGKPAGNAAHYRGYSYYQLGIVWQDYGFAWPAEISDLDDWLNRFPPEERSFLYRGMSYGIDFDKMTPAEAAQEALQLEIPRRFYFLEAFGYSLARRAVAAAELQVIENMLTGMLPDEVEYWRRGAATASAVYQPAQFLENLAQELDAGAAPDRVKSAALGLILAAPEHPFQRRAAGLYDRLPEPLRAKVWEGAGWQAAGKMIFDRAAFQEAIRMPAAYGREFESDFHRGLGWGFCREMPEDLRRGQDWIERFPPGIQPGMKEGFDVCRKSYVRT